MVKTLLLVKFLNFEINFFPWKSVCYHSSTWVSGAIPQFRKTNDRIPRKHTERHMARQTLFYRTLPATARGL